MDRCHDSIPPRAGVGLRAKHFATVLERAPAISFFEVHAENFMGAGGPPHRYLTAIRQRYPLSLHGVGLSIGAAGALDRGHLMRLRQLIERYQPGLFSEHLAWSTHGRSFLADLLPVPYTTETLHCVVRHIDQVQEALGRQMLLENPATYLAFADSAYAEGDFIAEVVRRTGCALLLDINNVHVSCTNQQWDPGRYLDTYPLAHVREIHLAGHSRIEDEAGRPLLIDSHDGPVCRPVWRLYTRVLDQLGAVPTLIEWDSKLPAWGQLEREAARANRLLSSQAQRHRGNALPAAAMTRPLDEDHRIPGAFG
ncbi:MAG TPA: DUF692 domain-containing protein [Steroidobacteraceae bacterium]|nr:DUF692 domain-containing protein [Steroidobacteraceae bacterium]